MGEGRAWFVVLCQSLGIAEPYKWQCDAFDRLLAGRPPSHVQVPTAAGKTMLLACFVAALGAQAREGRPSLPRRLVHVVNRRVLVDEANDLAARIRAALDRPGLAELRAALSGLSASGVPLVVSSLRGGVQDDGEWAVDPSTPALILATPDMLGSRLLFRGYGLGRSRAATQAGLLGCDTLVVHDEAHLSPAFSSLLRQVESLAKPDARQVARPALRVTEMTATLAAVENSDPLVCDVNADGALRARMSAFKRLSVVDVIGPEARPGKPGSHVATAIAERALSERDRNQAVAIFVSSPGTADNIAAKLSKAGVAPEQVVLLTGTLRGHERSRLSTLPAFLRFSTKDDRLADRTAYFIATSAGEIGLDIDADLGLFDLTTVERFIQRCGRVNRRGLVHGKVELFHAGGTELPAVLQERAQAALGLLVGLPTVDADEYDASPLALSCLCELPAYPQACEPPPAMRRLEAGVLDQWSLTSLSLAQLRCPGPGMFVRGLVEDDVELRLVWRQLPAPGANLAAWLDCWPVEAAEVAKLPFEAAARLLRERLFVHLGDDGNIHALQLDGQGAPVAGGVLRGGENVYGWMRRLRPGDHVVLSGSLGGLSDQGVPSLECDQPVPDVSFGFIDSNELQRERLDEFTVSAALEHEQLVWRSGDQEASSLPELLAKVAGELEVVFHDGPLQTGGERWEGVVRVWLSQPALRTADSGDQASLVGRDRGLAEHLDLTARAARRLTSALGLPQELQDTQTRSGHVHDAGKAWERWQRSIGNTDMAHPLAKSARAWFNHKVNDGYRHELGSIIGTAGQLSPLECHLVASHHGWCRPGFRAAALDKVGCAEAAESAASSYATLQRRYGRWGLCYLEAVLKAADILAERLHVELSLDRTIVLPAPHPVSTSEVVAVDKSFRLRVDASNFGEYLAGLGLAFSVGEEHPQITLGWESGELVLDGVDASDVLPVLRDLALGMGVFDEAATVPEMVGASYPPLLLRTRRGDMALNHWLSEELRDKSDWKLGAGQTTAAGTLTRVLQGCAESLSLDGFRPEDIFVIGSGLLSADVSKFRFDAATNWTARDAGFSFNETRLAKSSRPWVELLSALGLQHVFPPPADTLPEYCTWRGRLPLLLVRAAAKGLLPASDALLCPVIEHSGQMKDVFFSRVTVQERNASCLTPLLVI